MVDRRHLHHLPLVPIKLSSNHSQTSALLRVHVTVNIQPPGPVQDDWSEPPPPPPADAGVQFVEQPAAGGIQFAVQPAAGDNEWSDYDSDEEQHSRQTRPSVR